MRENRRTSAGLGSEEPAEVIELMATESADTSVQVATVHAENQGEGQDGAAIGAPPSAAEPTEAVQPAASDQPDTTAATST